MSEMIFFGWRISPVSLVRSPSEERNKVMSQEGFMEPFPREQVSLTQKDKGFTPRSGTLGPRLMKETKEECLGNGSPKT